MGAGPSVKVPTARYCGIRGERARVFTAMKRKYGVYWVRASNGDAYARWGANPYSDSPFAFINDAMIDAYRKGVL